ncbi:MAG: magnesium transporter CorA family protein [Spirochaetales bacterium]|nr:magnesium transporter CorA family protein [Spirochaetales bacterium]
MITIWKTSENRLVKSAILEKESWIEVSSPTDLERESLIQDYRIPEDLIMDILDEDERPRTERFNGSVCLIVRIPVYEKDRDVSYFTLPLGIIITDNIILTICSRQTAILEDLVRAPRPGHNDEEVRPGNTVSFILAILLNTVRYYLSFLKMINRRTSQIEKDLQQSVKNTELVHLLRLEKSLVYFTTSLKGNEMLLERFDRIMPGKIDAEQTELLDDLRVEQRQAIEMTNIYSNILSGLMDAFASVISNNLNVVMKRLTQISLTLMIPTFLASLYGMNVINLPFHDRPWAFAGIIGLSVVLSGISALLFTRRRKPG